ncbi:MAG: hypothetical protein A3J37_05250 [Alphaproteobacteria bacterium RIFCSPHIGHO2_12_FULL_45_9]|nr:MAG: hypothetical protein A3B66_01740 [Alphaproteobacteria bacterium RIFCSPHIGHO2_02_FULL_46_13]OFW94053.1 MAG: hypothetical protein A3J37_05250 [Alphaproteobacteria bacterium RIFCSPHIGHO2_12_FULL_45_9]
MNGQNLTSKLWLPALGVALFLTAILCRPLLPIDETRYMSVAWEMSLHHGWLDPLTKNFEPYSHKPPLLFWLINAFWGIFGISRWAGTLPAIISSILCIYLTGILGRKIVTILSKDDTQSPHLDTQRLWIMMAASFPFMVYGTLVMFDFLVCVFTLLSLILVLKLSETRRLTDFALLGLCLGFGVLAKGPVAYLYVLPCYLLAPLWKKDLTNLKGWYLSLIGVILVSAAPVLFWLVPVLKESNNQFAFWLVWNQTAGRVTGNFGEAHVRPFYFYLPLLPAFLMPWVLFPAFWRSLPKVKAALKIDQSLRFILCWFVPVFVAFSLISGKQPHYMVPLVPAMILFAAIGFQNIQTKTLAKVLTIVSLLFIGGQIIAKHSFFDKYDLKPLVEVIHQYPDTPLAYVSNYHAEFNFLARRTTHIDDVNYEDLPQWFEKNPTGLAIVKYHEDEAIKHYPAIFNMNYRGRNIGIFSKPPKQDQK